MINIYQKQTNTITVNSLKEKTSIPDASLHYLWNFVDFYNREVNIVLNDISSYPDRYSTFLFTDGSDGTLRANGEYNIYESPNDSTVIDPSIMNLLVNDQYTFFEQEAGDFVFDPSIFTDSDQDSVFSPIFNPGGAPSPTTVNHDDLEGRDNPVNHPWAIADVSLSSTFYWQGGLLQVDSSAVSGAVTMGYVDGSLNERDTSISALFDENDTQQDEIDNIYDFTLILQNGIIANDASIVDIVDDLEVQEDAIIDLYTSKQDNIPDGTFVKEASIGEGLFWVNGSLDVSVAGGGSGDVTQLYVDGSLALRDASIDKNINDIDSINDSIISVDASITDLKSEDIRLDGSINLLFEKDIELDSSINNLYDIKQDKITDGTFVKEASIGEGLVWNADALDVSIAQGMTDVSMGGLSDATVTNASTGDVMIYDNDQFVNTPATDIADILVDINDILVPLEGLVYSVEEVDASFALKTEISPVKGAINTDAYPEEADASIFKGIDASGNLMFKKLIGTTAIDIIEYDTYIDINLDASFSGEVNTASNVVGGDASIFRYKAMEDLEFRNLSTNTPSVVTLSNDSSTVYIDVDAAGSLSGLNDVTITDVSTSNILMYETDEWVNKETEAIEDILVDIADILVDAEEIFYTKELADSTFIKESSLGESFVWDGSTLDVSVGGGTTINSLNDIADVSVNGVQVGQLLIWTDASLWEAAETIELTQNYLPESSLGPGWIWSDGSYGYNVDLSGTYSQEYIDGSLNNKQDIIEDGTFVKEASLGEGLVWEAGMLDVSVAGGGSISIPGANGDILYSDGVGDVSTGTLNYDGQTLTLNRASSRIYLGVDGQTTPNYTTKIGVNDVSTANAGTLTVFGGDNISENPSCLGQKLIIKAGGASYGTGGILDLRAGNGLTNGNILIGSAATNNIEIGSTISNVSIEAVRVDIDSSLYINGVLYEASVSSGVSQAYVDGSLGTRDNSINANLTSINANQSAIDAMGTMIAYDYWNGTQAEYDALTPDSSTIYFINE